MVMSAVELRRHCLSLTTAVEEFPFGPDVSVFKVGGKIFALIAQSSSGHTVVSVKCDPEIAVGLRAAHPGVVPGYHLNKRHWNTVTVDGKVPDRLVRHWVEDSFDLVVDSLPRHQRIRIR